MSNDFTTLLLAVIVINVTFIFVSRVALDFDIELVFDKLHECDEWKGYAEEVKSIRKTYATTLHSVIAHIQFTIEVKM